MSSEAINHRSLSEDSSIEEIMRALYPQRIEMLRKAGVDNPEAVLAVRLLETGERPSSPLPLP